MAYSPPGKTRQRVFDVVRDALGRGEPPTVRDVQRALGFASVESARRHLEALVSEGRLIKAPGVARGYRLPASDGAVLVPHLGKVRAGPWTEAVEDADGHVPVAAELAGRRGSRRLFALTVEGDSMVGVGILAGDTIIVRQQSDAASGSVVVATADGEATVKTLRRRGKRVELHPANPDYPVLKPRQFGLLGVVVEVRRRLDVVRGRA